MKTGSVDLPEEYEFIEFLGLPTNRLEDGVPWFYNEVHYKVEIGKDSCLLKIHPACGEFEIECFRDGRIVSHYDFDSVSKAVFERTKGGQVMTLEFRCDETVFKLWLRPEIRTFCGVGVP